MPEYGIDGYMKWERVVPPIPWIRANRVIVADRHLPDGTRQHMVAGTVVAGLVVANAQVIGQDDVPHAEFSVTPSPLSQQQQEHTNSLSPRSLFLNIIRNKPMRESAIEEHLHKRVKELGGDYRRVSWIGRNGANDDLILLPDQKRHVLVECKRPKKAATTAQLREHGRLRDAGFEVYVVSTIAEVDAIFPPPTTN